MSAENLPAVGATAGRRTAYGALVNTPDDLVGLLAYALYKQAKIEFQQTHQQEHGIAAPDAVLDGFCRTALLQSSVESRRERAGQLLQSMTGRVLDANIADVRQLYINEAEAIKTNYEERLQEAVQKFHPHGFWKAVLEHALAGFIVWVVVAALILLAIVSQKGLVSVVESFGYQVQKLSK